MRVPYGRRLSAHRVAGDRYVARRCLAPPSAAFDAARVAGAVQWLPVERLIAHCPTDVAI